jgi:hypothetical protein
MIYHSDNQIVMEIKLTGRPKGKSFVQKVQLFEKIAKGLKCAIVTKDPKSVKKDFEKIIGAKLNLELIGEDIYAATLNL